MFLEDIQHVNRSRIPERMFHARGTAVHGYFEVTQDVTKYCAANFLSEVGKRTPIFCRFSIGPSQLGVAETVNRGIRGMAIKFYTEEGNYDLTLLSEPIFIIDDPIKIFNSSNAGNAHMINTRTNLPDQNTYWDFISLEPSIVHFVLWQYSDTGLPDGYRHMDFFGNNTYKFINQHGEQVYIRYHIETDQGVRNLTPEKATQLAGSNPDYATQDLVEAVARGNYPSWTMFIQVMSFEEAEKVPFNPFDPTKLWAVADFPLLEVGRMKMNRNVQNHWDESEQSVFSPGNFVPGIRASPDKVLQGRLLNYSDAQMYRMGVNHNQLPINQPLERVSNYQRDGRGVYLSQGAVPHYFPNSFGGPVEDVLAAELDPSYRILGDVQRREDDNIDYFKQPREYWNNILGEDHRGRVIGNIAASLRMVTKIVRERSIGMLANVDKDIEVRLRRVLIE